MGIGLPGNSDPAPAATSEVAYDLHAAHRPSALPPNISQLTHITTKMRVEVTTAGVLVGDYEGKGGLLIVCSSSLKVQCALPASVVLVIPIATADTGAVAEGSQEEVTSLSPWEWSGEPTGDTYSQVSAFLTAVTPACQDLRISFACADRLQRDALALSIRALAAMTNADPGRRLRVLPWYVNEEWFGRRGDSQQLVLTP